MSTLRTIREEERALLAKFGYFIHHVRPDKATLYADSHTHGLKKSRNHPELQAVLPLHPDILHQILHNAVRVIDTGEHLQNDTYISGILDTYKVHIRSYMGEKGSYFRLILPDPNGKFPGDPGCNPLYKGQASDPPDIEDGLLGGLFS